MLVELINSGLLNPTLWMAVAGALWLTTNRPRWLRPWVLWCGFGCAAASSALTLSVGVYRSFAVPRDVMQDIVAAQEYAVGRPMQPADMNAKMAEAVDREGPRRSLVWWHDGLAAQERQQREAMRREHWVQAHPPLVTVLTAPLVTHLGVLGTQVVYTLFGLAGLGVTLAFARWKFGLSPWTAPAVLGTVAVFGWAAVVAAVRTQQLSLPLLGLFAAGWVFLRRGKDIPAGVCVGLAVCLKLIPGVLLLPLVVRHRRGFVAAVAVIAAVAALLLAVVPWDDLVGYRMTSSAVIDEYAGYHANISLLGVYARCGFSLGLPLSYAEGLWVFTLGAVGLGWAYALFHHPKPEVGRRAVVDFEWAVGVSLIPLLSPVAWDHYLVFLLLPLIQIACHVRESNGRGGRVLLGLLIVALAVPDAAILKLDELLRGEWRWVAVWVVLPFRTLAMCGLTAWAARVFLDRTAWGLTLHPRPATHPGLEPAGRFFSR